MKKTVGIFLVLFLLLALVKYPIQAEDSTVNSDPMDQVVELSLKISRIQGLDEDEKQQLQEYLLEMIHESQLDIEDVLAELDHIQLEEQVRSAERIQLRLTARIRGLEEEVIDQLLEGKEPEEQEKIIELINEAFAEGVSGAELRELLQNREMNQGREQLEEAIEAIRQEEGDEDREEALEKAAEKFEEKAERILEKAEEKAEKAEEKAEEMEEKGLKKAAEKFADKAEKALNKAEEKAEKAEEMAERMKEKASEHKHQDNDDDENDSDDDNSQSDSGGNSKGQDEDDEE